jgi:pimeloyl-ACP methyl ester carboxylesterase
VGGLVAANVAVERPDLIRGLVLVGPALPISSLRALDRLVSKVFAVYMVPGLAGFALAQRMRQVGPERMLKDMMTLCGVDPKKLPDGVWDHAVSLAKERRGFPWADTALVHSARSIVRTNVMRRAGYARLERIRTPTLLMQGTRDRLIPFESSKAIADRMPHWRFEVLEGAGHVPQLEIPARWSELVLDFARSLGDEPRAAAAI